MARRSGAKSDKAVRDILQKCPSGIRGLDEITNGGLPRGRPTLVSGAAGSGKTLLAIEFLVRGIREHDEPGLFVAFEETIDELTKNVSSLGFDIRELMEAGKLAIDYVYIERSEIEETGEFDIEGLFVRMGSLIDEVGAKRVAIDSIEALFAGLPNEAILRSELRRLFRWLKGRGVTTVITGEQGQNALTRHGLEEYVSDCVIFLDHRVKNQVATRRLRVVKYRGSRHGTDEYPTMIDDKGLAVLPISSLGLDYDVSSERVSSGIKGLDAMLGEPGGYYRGSSILISGTAGAGKSSIAASFADGMCSHKQRVLYFSFEESPHQIMRNMKSLNIPLKKWLDRGLLEFRSTRPTLYGLESHLVNIHKTVDEFDPVAVIMDPITNLTSIGEGAEVRAMMIRLIDFLKSRQITALFTSLTSGGAAIEQSEVGISSLMDTWLLLRMVESSNERNRLLYVLKSRGMAHSNQMREFLLSSDGIKLVDVYVGPGEVYTGSARLAQEARDRASADDFTRRAARHEHELRQEEQNIKAQMEALKTRHDGIVYELAMSQRQEEQRLELQQEARKQQGTSRKVD